MQNLTIDYSTDTNGRILSATYNETGGFNGNLAYVYDNYGNISDLLKDDGNSAKAILINPNNGTIDTRYNPNGIDDPFTYRVRDGFMSIEDLWAGGGGTVYMQGHLVIPNPWGNTVTNGTTTTTTTDTTDKDGGGGSCDYSDCKPDVSNCNDYDWYTQQGDNTPKTFGEEFTEAYEDAKDKDCDQLEEDWENRFNDFTTHDYVSPGTYYYNLNPFDDDIWHSQVKPPSTCASPGCEASYRYSAGVLQILDCLMKKKGCRAYPTNNQK